MKTFKKLYSFLDYREKKQVKYFIGFLFIATFLEAISISLIFPSLSLIIDSSDKTKFSQFWEIFPSLKDISTTNLIIIFVSLFLTVNLFKTIFLIFFSWWRNDFIFKLDTSIHSNLYQKYIHSSLTFFSKKNSSTFTKNIINESKKIRVSIDAYLKIFTEIFIIITIGIVLVFYQPLPSLFILIFFGFFGLIINKFLRYRIHKYGSENVIQWEKVFINLKDVFGSFKDIKIRNNYDYFFDKFYFHLKNALRTLKYLFIISETVKFLFELLAIIFFCLLVLLLINININPKDIIPALALFAAAAYRFLPGINRIIIYFQTIQSSKAAIDLLHNDLKRKKIKANDTTKSKLSFKKEIFFKNVSYKYPKTSKNILKNFNFKIKRNDFICISGESGRGKTTFLDLLSGLIEPVSGKIFVDKVDINTKIRMWINNIGYVHQKVYLIDDTIKNNIAFDGKKINEEKLKYAVKLAQLDKLINNKKNGLNYRVGDDGSRLSGGQIKRIGIARSLYQMPQVLIYDEITSSLDKETEQSIIKTLVALTKKLTVIFITHRPDIVKGKNVKKFFLSKNGSSTRLIKLKK
ncbi:ABC transporter ATP-binding protein/permease [Pelagibacteraceae bacterium]|nr:ABC transporter ATP-binding protein/permease [Pelagibacteraceae bacterium]